MNAIYEKILVHRVKCNDRNAAEKLIKANYKQVYSLLLSLCNHKYTAEDLTQETFFKIWKSIHKFNGNCRFATWTYRIAYNTFLDWKRNQRELFDDILDLDPLYETLFNDDNRLLKEDSLRLFHQISQLPEKLQTVIRLHYQFELSITEISGVLDIPIGTVKSRLNAALEKLRQNKCVQELK